MTAPTLVPSALVQHSSTRGDGQFGPILAPFIPPPAANPPPRIILQILPIRFDYISMADPGTYNVTGLAANDALASQAGVGAYSVSGVGAVSVRDVPSTGGSGAYTVTGIVANDAISSQAGIGSYSVAGVAADDAITLNVAVLTAGRDRSRRQYIRQNS